MASKNSKKYKRLPKHFRLKGLLGHKENVFYFDEKSKHPFVSQSKSGEVIYGHNITHSPSLNSQGKAKAKYRRFPSKIQLHDPRPSYFDSTLERIDNAAKPGKPCGRLKRKSWKVSQANRKKLRKAEKARKQRRKNAR